MPFTDDGRFYHDRVLDHGDTWKMAAEKLARAIETFLYAKDDPGYGSWEYLAWSVADYDARKNSSGNVAPRDWDPDDPMLGLSPIDPLSGRRDQLDTTVRYPLDAKSKHSVINTNPGPEEDMIAEGAPVHAGDEESD